VEGALGRFPGLTVEGVSAALEFAQAAVERDLRYSPDPRHGVSELRERVTHGAAVLAPAPHSEPSEPRPDSTENTLRYVEERREQLLYELDLIESIRAGLQDAIDGNVLSHEEVVAYMHTRLPG